MASCRHPCSRPPLSTHRTSNRAPLLALVLLVACCSQHVVADVTFTNLFVQVDTRVSLRWGATNNPPIPSSVVKPVISPNSGNNLQVVNHTNVTIRDSVFDSLSLLVIDVSTLYLAPSTSAWRPLILPTASNNSLGLRVVSVLVENVTFSVTSILRINGVPSPSIPALGDLATQPLLSLNLTVRNCSFLSGSTVKLQTSGFPAAGTVIHMYDLLFRTSATDTLNADITSYAQFYVISLWMANHSSLTLSRVDAILEVTNKSGLVSWMAINFGMTLVHYSSLVLSSLNTTVLPGTLAAAASELSCFGSIGFIASQVTIANRSSIVLSSSFLAAGSLPLGASTLFFIYTSSVQISNESKLALTDSTLVADGAVNASAILVVQGALSASLDSVAEIRAVNMIAEANIASCTISVSQQSLVRVSERSQFLLMDTVLKSSLRNNGSTVGNLCFFEGATVALSLRSLWLLRNVTMSANGPASTLSALSIYCANFFVNASTWSQSWDTVFRIENAKLSTVSLSTSTFAANIAYSMFFRNVDGLIRYNSSWGIVNSSVATVSGGERMANIALVDSQMIIDSQSTFNMAQNSSLSVQSSAAHSVESNLFWDHSTMLVTNESSLTWGNGSAFTVSETTFLGVSQSTTNILLASSSLIFLWSSSNLTLSESRASVSQLQPDFLMNLGVVKNSRIVLEERSRWDITKWAAIVTSLAAVSPVSNISNIALVDGGQVTVLSSSVVAWSQLTLVSQGSLMSNSFNLLLQNGATFSLQNASRFDLLGVSCRIVPISSTLITTNFMITQQSNIDVSGASNFTIDGADWSSGSAPVAEHITNLWFDDDSTLRLSEGSAAEMSSSTLSIIRLSAGSTASNLRWSRGSALSVLGGSRFRMERCEVSLASAVGVRASATSLANLLLEDFGAISVSDVSCASFEKINWYITAVVDSLSNVRFTSNSALFIHNRSQFWFFSGIMSALCGSTTSGNVLSNVAFEANTTLAVQHSSMFGVGNATNAICNRTGYASFNYAFGSNVSFAIVDRSHVIWLGAQASTSTGGSVAASVSFGATPENSMSQSASEAPTSSPLSSHVQVSGGSSLTWNTCSFAAFAYGPGAVATNVLFTGAVSVTFDDASSLGMVSGTWTTLAKNTLSIGGFVPSTASVLMAQRSHIWFRLTSFWLIVSVVWSPAADGPANAVAANVWTNASSLLHVSGESTILWSTNTWSVNSSGVAVNWLTSNASLLNVTQRSSVIVSSSTWLLMGDAVSGALNAVNVFVRLSSTWVFDEGSTWKVQRSKFTSAVSRLGGVATNVFFSYSNVTVRGSSSWTVQDSDWRATVAFSSTLMCFSIELDAAVVQFQNHSYFQQLDSNVTVLNATYVAWVSLLTSSVLQFRENSSWIQRGGSFTSINNRTDAGLAAGVYFGLSTLLIDKSSVWDVSNMSMVISSQVNACWLYILSISGLTVSTFAVSDSSLVRLSRVVATITGTQRSTLAYALSSTSSFSRNSMLVFEMNQFQFRAPGSVTAFCALFYFENAYLVVTDSSAVLLRGENSTMYSTGTSAIFLLNPRASWTFSRSSALTVENSVANITSSFSLSMLLAAGDVVSCFMCLPAGSVFLGVISLVLEEKSSFVVAQSTIATRASPSAILSAPFVISNSSAIRFLASDLTSAGSIVGLGPAHTLALRNHSTLLFSDTRLTVLYDTDSGAFQPYFRCDNASIAAVLLDNGSTWSVNNASFSFLSTDASRANAAARAPLIFSFASNRTVAVLPPPSHQEGRDGGRQGGDESAFDFGCRKWNYVNGSRLSARDLVANKNTTTKNFDAAWLLLNCPTASYTTFLSHTATTTVSRKIVTKTETQTGPGLVLSESPTTQGTSHTKTVDESFSHTVLPAAPPPTGMVLPPIVVASTSATAALGAVAVPVAALAANRIAAAARLGNCDNLSEEDSDNTLNSDLPFMNAPLQLTFGPPRGEAHRGAVVGNIVVWLICVAVGVCLSLAVRLTGRRPEEESAMADDVSRAAGHQRSYDNNSLVAFAQRLVDDAASLRLPGLYFIVVALQLEQVLTSSVLLLQSGTLANSDEWTARNTVVGVVGLLVGLGICAAIARVLNPRSSAFRALASFNPRERGVMTCSVRSVLHFLTADDTSWRPRNVGTDRLFVQRYGFLFEGCRRDRHWWMLVDLSMTIAMSILGGVVPGTTAACEAIAWLTVVTSVVYFVALVWLRPMCTMLETGTAVLLAGTQLSVTVANVANASDGVVNAIATVGALAAIGLVGVSILFVLRRSATKMWRYYLRRSEQPDTAKVGVNDDGATTAQRHRPATRQQRSERVLSSTDRQKLLARIVENICRRQRVLYERRNESTPLDVVMREQGFVVRFAPHAPRRSGGHVSRRSPTLPIFGDDPHDR